MKRSMEKVQKKQCQRMTNCAEHASRKARAVWELRPTIEEKLKENELFELYHELELPLAKILSKMEVTGVKTDLKDATRNRR